MLQNQHLSVKNEVSTVKALLATALEVTSSSYDHYHFKIPFDLHYNSVMKKQLRPSKLFGITNWSFSLFR